MTPARPHVLVVDDTADNRGLLIQWLEHAYRVSEAADGSAALARIAADPPDLVLLDLMMPVLDGFSVLQALREREGRFLPVIVISAANEREARLRALRLGAHEFVGKPLDRDELLVRIETLLALKASRDALAAHASELDRRVAERTAELERSLVALREADRYKDEFLGVLSHELRTPLNFIMGFASILADEISGPLNETQHDQLAKIMVGADRMLRLVEDLLDIARIHAGRIEVRAHETDYVELVRATVETLAVSAAERDVELELDLAPVGRLAVDEVRIAQVITNLLSNALKFSPPGRTVRVSTRATPDGVWTAVADEGPGVPPGEVPRIFEKFRQLDMSLTRNVGGTGLGLAISKGLVEAHGGQIGVETRPGEGATFWFTLPGDVRPQGEPRAVRAGRAEVPSGMPMKEGPAA